MRPSVGGQSDSGPRLAGDLPETVRRHPESRGRADISVVDHDSAESARATNPLVEECRPQRVRPSVHDSTRRGSRVQLHVGCPCRRWLHPPGLRTLRSSRILLSDVPMLGGFRIPQDEARYWTYPAPTNSDGASAFVSYASLDEVTADRPAQQSFVLQVSWHRRSMRFPGSGPDTSA